jgi:hypothetical protein
MNRADRLSMGVAAALDTAFSDPLTSLNPMSLIAEHDGGQHEGVTNAAGVVELAELPPGAVQVRFEPDGRSWERLDGSDNPHAVSPRPERAEVDSLIDRARGSQP